jgi:flavin-dependent dehydrogenase
VYYDKIVSYGIRRCEFDDYLLQRSGARLRLGEAWESMERVNGRWLVNGAIDAAIVIGAGGHFCPVVRFLGANLGKGERAIAAQEIEFEMNDDQALRCGVEHDRPELYFCDDLKGYGWCFRKGNFLNVGLGRDGNHRLPEHVHAFSRWLQSQGKVPADAPARFKGHAYLLYSHAKRPVVGDGVLIIGDAAGLAYAESGEGIRPAIESGLMAAQIIANARGDYSKQRLNEYEAQLTARFGARNHGGSLASSLPESWKLALARSLMQRQWFTRNVVLNRWFLHADTAPLRA